MKKIKFKLSKKSRWFLLAFIFVIVVAGLIYISLVFKNRNVVAVVNGYPITIKDILVEMDVSPYGETLGGGPTSVVDAYINQILLFQEAKKYERRLKRNVNDIMKNHYIKELTKEYVDKIYAEKIIVTEEDVAEYYNTHLEEFLIPEKVRLFEIVLSTQEKAENIRRRLSSGESFELIAMNESVSASNERAGDLGWIDIRKLEPQIAALVSRMVPGDILADIIQTEAGYHIIKLAGKTESIMLSLEDAAPSIKEMLVSFRKKGEVEAFVSKLKEQSRTKIYSDKIEKLQLQ
jgi:parvulin-like peptidyl-prolyl isomerase